MSSISIKWTEVRRVINTLSNVVRYIPKGLENICWVGNGILRTFAGIEKAFNGIASVAYFCSRTVAILSPGINQLIKEKGEEA